jgi:CubicO group peptidase (beta-lactamase class C family)
MLDQVDTGALDSYLAERTEQDLFSGVVRITRDGEELFANAYGPATRAWDVPTTLDTRFDVASVTKLFTTVAVLQTVDEGLLALDTRAVDYLGLSGTSIHPDATLGHFLTHTSGIADDADEEAGEDYADVWKDNISYLVRTTDGHLPHFANKPGNFAPGEGCRYNNAGFILAGLMLERATGTSYIDRVQSHVFDRAAMSDSGFFSMDIVTPRVAEGADLVNGSWVRNIYSYPPVGSPDGGAHTTAADLERFMSALLRKELLGPDMTDMMLTPQVEHHTDEYGPLWYGYGLEFSYHPNGALMFFEKEGINAGVSAVVRHYPGSNVTVAMLSNMQEGIWEPRQHLHEMLWEGR